MGALERGSARRLEPRRPGSAEDLWAEIQRRKAIADSPLQYVAVQYVWAMVSGKAKLKPLDNPPVWRHSPDRRRTVCAPLRSLNVARRIGWDRSAIAASCGSETSPPRVRSSPVGNPSKSCHATSFA